MASHSKFNMNILFYTHILQTYHLHNSYVPYSGTVCLEGKRFSKFTLFEHLVKNFDKCLQYIGQKVTLILSANHIDLVWQPDDLISSNCPNLSAMLI